MTAPAGRGRKLSLDWASAARWSARKLRSLEMAAANGEARLWAADRLIRPYDPSYNLEPALFLSAKAWECLNKVNSQMP